MIDLANKIIAALEVPEGKDLQEHLLEAMYMMERYRNAPASGIECVPDVLDADVSAPAIQRLAAALEKFIRGWRQHRDVGSAVWALGALRDPCHASLFTAVADSSSGYNDWARDQALCALDNQK